MTCGVASTTNGAAFNNPAFAGFTGNVPYGDSNAPAGTTATLVASTTNVNGRPTPAGMTVDYYLDVTFSSSVAFTANNRAATLFGGSLNYNNMYSVYVYANGSLLYTASLGQPNALPSFPFSTPYVSYQSPFGSYTVAPNTPVTIEIAH